MNGLALIPAFVLLCTTIFCFMSWRDERRCRRLLARTVADLIHDLYARTPEFRFPQPQPQPEDEDPQDEVAAPR